MCPKKNRQATGNCKASYSSQQTITEQEVSQHTKESGIESALIREVLVLRERQVMTLLMEGGAWFLTSSQHILSHPLLEKRTTNKLKLWLLVGIAQGLDSVDDLAFYSTPPSHSFLELEASRILYLVDCGL